MEKGLRLGSPYVRTGRKIRRKGGLRWARPGWRAPRVSWHLARTCGLPSGVIDCDSPPILPSAFPISRAPPGAARSAIRSRGSRAQAERAAARRASSPRLALTDTFFISRHPGAAEWAERQGLQIDRRIVHLDPAKVSPRDTVAGTVPVHLAAGICARGARYLHLALDLPEHARGRELTGDELERFGARLEPFLVEHKVCASGCSLR